MSSILASFLLAASTVQAVAPSHYIFVFGDSYTTTGFNATAGPQPAVGDPFGNPVYPGKTLIPGKGNWIDVVEQNYTSNTTVFYNYATGGNVVNVSAVAQNPTTNGPIKSFIDQEAEFASLVESGSTSWTSDNSLFISWFGINDIASVRNNVPNSYDDSLPILEQDIADYFGLLTQQYHLGARNFISILVPPFYRTAIFGYGDTSNPNSVEIKNLTAYWNSQVQSQGFFWQFEHPDVTYDIVDPSDTFNKILDDPTAYGAPNASCATCVSYPQGEPCLWVDFIHPGVVIQDAFGGVMGPIVKEKGF